MYALVTHEGETSLHRGVQTEHISPASKTPMNNSHHDDHRRMEQARCH